MSIVVTTKDCTALSDAELAEMADLGIEHVPGYDIGYLSKEREEWVLVTDAREGSKLRGYSFCTLERIGGTPCLLWGLASVKRNARRDQVLKALVSAQFRRAVLASRRCPWHPLPPRALSPALDQARRGNSVPGR